MKLIFDLWFYIMILFIINLMLISTQRVKIKLQYMIFIFKISKLKLHDWSIIYIKIYLIF